MLRTTDRYKEARGAIRSAESIWEQLQPCIVSVHDELPALLRFELCQPCVLMRQGRGGVIFGEVQDKV